MTARPWRAAAYLPGHPRRYLGNISAKTRDGLDRFIAHWSEVGATVECWEVLDHPEVTAAAQASAAEPALR